VTEIRTLVGSVAGLVELADTTVTSAAATAARADRVATGVEAVMEIAEQGTDPARTLVDAATTIAPQAASLAPDLLRALGELASRMPELLRRVETQVLPMLDELESTPADVRALKDSVEEIEPKLDGMEAELAGIPGAKALRRRGRRAKATPDADGAVGTRDEW
jgi:predicted NBD/HSP70 family sugar kinase